MAGRKPTKEPSLPVPPSYEDDMKRLQELLGRSPSAARATDFVKGLVAGWRERLSLDAYQQRLDRLTEDLDAGIEQVVQDAGEIDRGSEAEIRKANSAAETMRTMLCAAQDAEPAPA